MHTTWLIRHLCVIIRHSPIFIILGHQHFDINAFGNPILIDTDCLSSVSFYLSSFRRILLESFWWQHLILLGLAGIEEGAQVNTVDSVAGKTGAVSLGKADVGLANVDNTSDADKPVSNAQQTALNLKETVANVNTLKGAGLGW